MEDPEGINGKPVSKQLVSPEKKKKLRLLKWQLFFCGNQVNESLGELLLVIGRSRE